MQMLNIQRYLAEQITLVGDFVTVKGIFDD